MTCNTPVTERWRGSNGSPGYALFLLSPTSASALMPGPSLYCPARQACIHTKYMFDQTHAHWAATSHKKDASLRSPLPFKSSICSNSEHFQPTGSLKEPQGQNRNHDRSLAASNLFSLSSKFVKIVPTCVLHELASYVRTRPTWWPPTECLYPHFSPRGICQGYILLKTLPRQLPASTASSPAQHPPFVPFPFSQTRARNSARSHIGLS